MKNKIFHRYFSRILVKKIYLVTLQNNYFSYAAVNGCFESIYLISAIKKLDWWKIKQELRDDLSLCVMNILPKAAAYQVY